MKTKILGFALMISLAATLGACEQGAQEGTTSTPEATTPATTDTAKPAPEKDKKN
ncbi:MAG: hypothetical protein QNJ47_24635 [Nostocaceae cyanobacterium]|nr:hypothetical protein [Nostocaceae cyanobacterium]